MLPLFYRLRSSTVSPTDALRKDLEHLLNSRSLSSIQKNVSKYKQVESSIINFGISDYADMIRHSSDVQKVAGLIEHTIKMFEPRITNLFVKPENLEQHKDKESTFRFFIEGKIYYLESKENQYISFHTDLDLSNGKIKIG